MAIPIPVGFPGESHFSVIFHYMHTSILDPVNAYFTHKMYQIAHICTCFQNVVGVTPSDHITGKETSPFPQTLLLGARPPCHIFRVSTLTIDVIKGQRPNVHFLHSSTEQYKTAED